MKKLCGIVIVACFMVTLVTLLITPRDNNDLDSEPPETQAHSVIRYTAEYDYAFISQTEPLYTYPGEENVVCEVPRNTVLTVLCMAVATDQHNGVSTDYLCVYTPTEKVPGNDIGWIPCSAIEVYSADMAERVDCPVTVLEGTEYYQCYDSADISQEDAQPLSSDMVGGVYRRENGYCEIWQKGSGELIWVSENDVEPNLVDASDIISSILG